jgi:hypothetical protein
MINAKEYFSSLLEKLVGLEILGADTLRRLFLPFSINKNYTSNKQNNSKSKSKYIYTKRGSHYTRRRGLFHHRHHRSGYPEEEEDSVLNLLKTAPKLGRAIGSTRVQSSTRSLSPRITRFPAASTDSGTLIGGNRA